MASATRRVRSLGVDLIEALITVVGTLMLLAVAALIVSVVEQRRVSQIRSRRPGALFWTVHIDWNARYLAVCDGKVLLFQGTRGGRLAEGADPPGGGRARRYRLPEPSGAST